MPSQLGIKDVFFYYPQITQIFANVLDIFASFKAPKEERNLLSVDLHLCYLFQASIFRFVFQQITDLFLTKTNPILLLKEPCLASWILCTFAVGYMTHITTF